MVPEKLTHVFVDKGRIVPHTNGPLFLLLLVAADSLLRVALGVSWDTQVTLSDGLYQ